MPKPSFTVFPLSGVSYNILTQRLRSVGLRVSFCLLCLLIFSPSNIRAETHTFTDGNGQPYPAQVIEVKGPDVIIRRSNGKVYNIDLASLSPADRQYVAEWKQRSNSPQLGLATTESAIDVNVAVNNPPAASSTKLSAKVTILNQEPSLFFKGLNGTLILVGQLSPGSAKHKVLALEKFAGDLTFEGKIDFTSQPIDATDSNPDSHQASYPYQGYIVILQNSDGNVIQFQHSGFFVKDAAAALKLQAGTTFTAPTPRLSRRIRLVHYPNESSFRANSALPTASGQ